jgi:hypothetical protein
MELNQKDTSDYLNLWFSFCTYILCWLAQFARNILGILGKYLCTLINNLEIFCLLNISSVSIFFVFTLLIIKKNK